MFPYFILFDKVIAMYGVMMVIAAFTGYGVAIVNTKLTTIPRVDIELLAALMLIAVLLGSKLLYILLSINEIADNISTNGFTLEYLYELLEGGFVFYGGLIAAFILVVWYAKHYKLPFITLMDIVVTSVPILHAIGRIGCFCAGCCYGKEWSGIFSVTFTRAIAAPNGVSLFPVQLLESLLNLVLFIALERLFIAKYKQSKNAPIISTYCIGYGIIRIITELFRGDAVRGVSLGISTSQIISIFIIAFGIIMLKYTKKAKS